MGTVTTPGQGQDLDRDRTGQGQDLDRQNLDSDMTWTGL